MSNGTIHYTYQCQNQECLQRPTEKFISRAELRLMMSEDEIAAIPAFDHAGRSRVNKNRLLAAAEKRASFWERYSAYLESPDWAETRARIMAHAMRPVCEMCHHETAVHVHHLPGSYEHLGAERDEELLALCKPCHQAQHPDKDLG